MMPRSREIFLQHVYQNPDKKIEVDTTQGFEQWNQFISMVQDTSQQALLGRCKFIGIKNDRFCIAASVMILLL